MRQGLLDDILNIKHHLGMLPTRFVYSPPQAFIVSLLGSALHGGRTFIGAASSLAAFPCRELGVDAFVLVRRLL